MLKNSNQNSQDNCIDDSSLQSEMQMRDTFDLVLGNWRWFVISILACLAVAFFYLKSTSPTYKRSAVMLVKEEQGRRTDDIVNAIMEMNGTSMGSNINNEIYILHSYQLLQEVVKRLNLNNSYYLKERFRYAPIYGNQVPFQLVTDPACQAYLSLHITPIDTLSCQLTESKVVTTDGTHELTDCILQWGDTLTLADVSFVLKRIALNPEQYGNIYRVDRCNLESAAYSYQSKISTSEVDKRSSLVNIVCTDQNIERADAVLNMLLKVYSEQIVEDKNRIATNTAQFVSDRIKIISEELGEVEEKLTRFKQQNNLVDIQANSVLYLQESSRAKEETIQLEAQLRVAQYLRDYLADHTKRRELIPNVGGGCERCIAQRPHPSLQREGVDT